MKKIGILFLVIVAVMITGRESLKEQKKDIGKFVLENESELENIAEQYLSGEGEPDFEGVKGIRYFPGELPIVEFETGGSGMVSCSTYYGFYYSPEDKPVAFMGSEEPLIQEEDGWMWKSEGDNHGHTSKITDKWYYYDASF